MDGRVSGRAAVQGGFGDGGGAGQRVVRSGVFQLGVTGCRSAAPWRFLLCLLSLLKSCAFLITEEEEEEEEEKEEEEKEERKETEARRR